ncbi:AMP-binding protein [Salipiger profundus]|uniref:AMP-binding protein n=1 Tax=Salipiger profundus TaxID=1229727 RepID=UPI0008E07058|nr:AMP-binding protein [Salipiger profundus]SFD37573.1 long-chain acyl-CoA synthetase [Salipiger profundus]
MAPPAACFQWSDTTRLLLRGRPLDDPAQDGATARDLHALRVAIRAEAEFTVGPEGIGRVPGGAPGWFRSRSSGTTGAAKTIRRSHGSWIASFEVNRAALGLGQGDVYAILGAPAHSLALYGIVEAAHLGADLHCVEGMRPDRQAACLATAGATVLYATPTQLRLLCDAGAPLPALRHILCGGGRMPAGLRARIAALCPNAVLREFYGAAETSFIAWGDAATPEGAVGRPYPGVEIRIAPSRGHFGEIWVRSPYLFEGYAEGGSPETRWQDGFVTVGEMGALDAEGNLTVAGRRKRMVTIADQNVFPEDIEATLLADPQLTHCAVVPLPDSKRGHVLVAVIAAPAAPGTAERLLRRGREIFGTLTAPRRVVEMDDFPLTVSGKPDLGEIARRLEAGA